MGANESKRWRKREDIGPIRTGRVVAAMNGLGR